MANSKRDYWPTRGWRASTPEEQGMDSELLAKALEFRQQHELNLHSMLIIRHGYIVADAYFYPFTQDSRHDIASIAKSIVSTLIGIAMDKGYIKSLNQPVLEFFPQRTVANVDANKKAMTLEHLLTMTPGLDSHDEDETTLWQMRASPDWVQFMLDLPMIEEPGSRFNYSEGVAHLLSAIIQETTGMSTLDFARKHLFEPLGISDFPWPSDPQGVNFGYGDATFMTPYDMAKIGYLYLNNGSWDGKQIVSRRWVRQSTSKQVPVGGDMPIDIDGYGYQWWAFSSNVATAAGKGGQRIYVLPDKDMVVVCTAGLRQEHEVSYLQLLTAFIMPAAKPTTPLPPNPGGAASLESRIQQATLNPDKPQSVPPLPGMAQQISGQKYELGTNPFQLEDFSLTFEKQDEALMNLTVADDTLALPIGLDNVFRIAPGRFGSPAALKGFWKKRGVFAFDFNEIGNINNWRATVRFEDDRVAIRMQERGGLADLTLAGSLRRQ